jgi:predicted nucleotidyltransferase component of viral defense system
MRSEVKDIVRSVHQRLVNHAHTNGEETQSVLMRFAVERLLYRLGASRYRDQFALKGAMLLGMWGGELHRPTTDLDLLGFDAYDVASLVGVFQEVCRVVCPDDGLVYDSNGIRGEPIREGQAYEGVRLSITARLGAARIPIHVDIAFGDPVTPQTQQREYPGILNLPRARLRTYPPETVVAEKLQAMVTLGLFNSRAKDFYDLWTLSRSLPFEGETLCRAIRATFDARRTPVPTETPISLTPAFYSDSRQLRNWMAFVRRLRLPADDTFADVGSCIIAFLGPPLTATSRREAFRRAWPPGGPWTAQED